MEPDPLFTVFTPTFNRGATLGEVYRSLESQTFRDFEWLIVDDGSEDETPSLVKAWQAGAGFPIRYFWQPNGGKHRAFNRGVREARGSLFLPLDSDDFCVPEALERLAFHWTAIPERERPGFSAVTALCKDPSGQIVGSGLPREFIDADSVSIRYRYHVAGEKWGFQRTDVLRQFPFPEIPGEKFVPESLVWNRIACRYRTRYVNEALRIYRPGSDSLSRYMVRLRFENPVATLLYYQELLEHPALSWRGKIRAAVNFVRFSRHAQKNAIVRLRVAKAWCLFLYPVGIIVCLWDKRRL